MKTHHPVIAALRFVKKEGARAAVPPSEQRGYGICESLATRGQMFRACAVILASFGFFHVALPKAEAELTGFVTLDGGAPISLGSQTGANPTISFFNNLGGVSLFVGAASNAPGTASIANLFDAAVFIANNTTGQHSLHFIFEEDAFTSPTGLVLATSNASASSTTGGVTLDSFSSIVDGTPIVASGLPISLSPGAPYSNATSNPSPISIPAGNFAMSQDFSFTMLPGETINFSNSLGAVPFPNVAPVPEPGTLIYGGTLVLAGGCQMLSRRRIRRIA